jgi:hypothetical protein
MHDFSDDKQVTARLKQIAENFSKNPMDPVMKQMFGDIKKQVILSMIEVGVVMGLKKGQVLTMKATSGEKPPTTENLKLIAEATAMEVYSMREEHLDIIFTI